MHLKILGTSSGQPQPGKAQSSVYLRTEEYNILLDCGEGTTQKLMEHGLTKNHIDAVVISHLHPDHVTGIYMMLQMIYLQGRTKPLKIFFPEQIDLFRHSLDLYYLFPERFDYKIEILPISELENHYSIKPVANDHLSGYLDIIRKTSLPNLMKSYSLLINEDNKYIMYTSDIGSLNSIENYLHDLDLIIVEGIHPDHHTILKLPEYRINRVIITHGLSPSLKDYLKKEKLPKNFEIAYDNLSLDL